MTLANADLDVVLQDYPVVEHLEIDSSQIQSGPIASYLSVEQFMDEDIRLLKADTYEDSSRTNLEQYIPPSVSIFANLVKSFV